MSSVEEDLRKIMNKTPGEDPFSETFDPSDDSLEAISGAIAGLEAGIFAYGLMSGPQAVEIDDKADFEAELLNPGGDIVSAGDITPGTYYISRIRNGTKTAIYNHAAVAANGKVILDTAYEFAVANWSPGDLIEVKFTGIETDINGPGGTVTKFPDMILQGRVVRDEEITDKIGTPPAILGDLVAMLGNPNVAGKTIYDNLGDFVANTNFKSLLTVLGGGWETANKDMYALLYTDLLGHATHGLAALDTDLGTIITNIGTPPANLVDIVGMLGNPDVAGKTIYDNLGDFVANTNFKSLLTVLGGGWETANKDMYALLYTDLLGHATHGLAALDTDLDAILADVGDASGATLLSLYGILGNPGTDSVVTVIGQLLDAALATNVASNGTNTEITLLRTILDRIGQTPAAADDAIHTIIGQRDAAALGKNVDDDGTQSAIALLRSLIDRIGNVGASDIDALIDAIQADIGDPSVRGNDPSLEQMLGVPDDVDGSLGDRLGFAHTTHPFTVAENLRAILGTGLTSTQHLYGILGGYTLADSLKVATDVLLQQDLTTQTRDSRSIAAYVEGIGINASPDGYDSSTVTANEDGSVFERLEDLKQLLDDNVTDASFTTVNDVAEHTVVTFTAHRTGELAVQLDLDELITAVEGGTVTVRLKHMINNVTRRTIDKATFIVGVDEVHPSVQGWVDKNNANGVEVTIQCSVAPTAGRSVPYKVMEAT